MAKTTSRRNLLKKAGVATFVVIGALILAPCAAKATNEAAQSASQSSTMSAQADVATAVSGFYEALNTLFTGDAEPMKKAWSHRGDISYMGPDGLYLIGWEKIEAMWGHIGALKLGGRVKPTQMNIVVGTDMALITCVERGENEVDSQAEQVSIRSSTVFRKEGAAWKVVAHQTDGLSFLTK